MQLGILLTMTVVCNAAILHTRKPKGCVTHVMLRDKWNFLNQGRRPFIRVRRGAFIFRNGKYRVKFKCVERFGNIYLLRKSKYKEGQDAVVCVGFTYIADHRYAEYTAVRLMEQGIGSHVMSPKLFPHGKHVSINSTCDFKGPRERRQYSYMRRAAPGCKFPKELRRTWNFTYMHARSLDISFTKIMLNLLDGRQLNFSCDARDSRRYVVRAHGFPVPDKDAFMCIHFMPVRDDPFYSYVFSRLNSGNLMDGMLRIVEKDQPVHMHQHCDWLDSPARPEFMYP
ncbi:uncharacterized protein [Littorina saxatilis]|uniref:uncharacterized protein n=1 Tax=Littorina saxatilis TaxID=31220 RepID=UPI0038B56B97